MYTIGLNVLLLLSQEFNRSNDNVDARLWSIIIIGKILMSLTLLLHNNYDHVMHDIGSQYLGGIVLIW